MTNITYGKMLGGAGLTLFVLGLFLLLLGGMGAVDWFGTLGLLAVYALMVVSGLGLNKNMGWGKFAYFLTFLAFIIYEFLTIKSSLSDSFFENAPLFQSVIVLLASPLILPVPIILIIGLFAKNK